MSAAFALMLMLMADGTGGFQFALEVSLHDGSGTTFRADDNLDIALVEDFDSATAHAASDDDLHTHVTQEVGQKPGLWPGFGMLFSETIFPFSASKIVKFSQWPKWPPTCFPMHATAIFIVYFSLFILLWFETAH